MLTAPTIKPGSERVTHGIRVTVWPSYLANQSDPADGRFVFAYRIRIVNESSRTVRLDSREWDIIDADGELKHVEGEGVVGQKPLLGPGQAFEYSSLCPLETAWGTMEGRYHFEAVGTLDAEDEPTAGGSDSSPRLIVEVGRFLLVGPRHRVG